MRGLALERRSAALGVPPSSLTRPNSPMPDHLPWYGVDYYATRSSSTEACIAGTKKFVCRYYDNSGGTSLKCLDLA